MTISRSIRRACPRGALLGVTRGSATFACSPLPFPAPLSTPSRRLISTNSLPIILQPQFWRSLTPKALRSDPNAVVPEAPSKPKKEWNPATFFIIIFLMIGSQGIQMVSLQSSFDNFSTQTMTKLDTLREVVKRVQNGEDVDVEGMLGTGDPVKEKEWEEVIRELEREDNRIRLTRRQKKARRPMDDRHDSDASAEGSATNNG